MAQYTKEQFWKLYKKLPEELQEAIFSMETADNIVQVCENHGIQDGRVAEIARYAGRVLMGLILPQEFSGVLVAEVKLQKTLADAITRDINRLVFYPVKPTLEQLHRMEIEVSAKIITPKPEEESEEEKPEEPEEPKGDDTYREPLE